MSIRVKEWLKRLGIETTDDERQDIDREIEWLTGLPCDDAVEKLPEEQFRSIIERVKTRKRRPTTIAEMAA